MCELRRTKLTRIFAAMSDCKNKHLWPVAICKQCKTLYCLEQEEHVDCAKVKLVTWGRWESIKKVCVCCCNCICVLLNLLAAVVGHVFVLSVIKTMIKWIHDDHMNVFSCKLVYVLVYFWVFVCFCWLLLLCRARIHTDAYVEQGESEGHMW